jgi:hypothetical protein
VIIVKHAFLILLIAFAVITTASSVSAVREPGDGPTREFRSLESNGASEKPAHERATPERTERGTLSIERLTGGRCHQHDGFMSNSGGCRIGSKFELTGGYKDGTAWGGLGFHF